MCNVHVCSGASQCKMTVCPLLCWWLCLLFHYCPLFCRVGVHFTWSRQWLFVWLTVAKCQCCRVYQQRLVNGVVLWYTVHCFPFITRKSSYCFQHVLAIAILSVRLSVTPVDQSKMVQARITKSSLSAVWKSLVSGTVKLFHKFEEGHLERGR